MTVRSLLPWVVVAVTCLAVGTGLGSLLVRRSDSVMQVSMVSLSASHSRFLFNEGSDAAAEKALLEHLELLRDSEKTLDASIFRTETVQTLVLLSALATVRNDAKAAERLLGDAMEQCHASGIMRCDAERLRQSARQQLVRRGGMEPSSK